MFRHRLTVHLPQQYTPALFLGASISAFSTRSMIQAVARLSAAVAVASSLFSNNSARHDSSPRM